MRLQVTQQNLNRALGTVARVANTRNQLPILANVLIKTDKNRLSISATNLDIAISQYIGGKVTEDGSITVPARLMQDFISSLPDGVIELKLEDTKLHIKTDKYQSVVNGVLADDFPVMPAIQSGEQLQIPSLQLKRALQQVVFAASSDESRPVLTGILLRGEGTQLHLAATDSYRLAEKTLNVPLAKPVDLLVPATAMHDLLRILGDIEDTVTITYDEQQVLFQVGDVELVARLLEGKYPDYQKLIPDQFGITAQIKRSELLNVTKVSSLFARESAGSITIEVDETAKQLSVHSVASQLGENTAAANGVITGNGTITLNSRYLLDGLGAISDDEVVFAFNGKLEPTVVRAAADSDYVHVIMPLKS
jgi:DNA polymerase-3 subunit beta